MKVMDAPSFKKGAKDLTLLLSLKSRETPQKTSYSKESFNVCPLLTLPKRRLESILEEVGAFLLVFPTTATPMLQHTHEQLHLPTYFPHLLFQGASTAGRPFMAARMLLVAYVPLSESAFGSLFVDTS